MSQLEQSRQEHSEMRADALKLAIIRTIEIARGDAVGSITRSNGELWVGRQRGRLAHLSFKGRSFTIESHYSLEPSACDYLLKSMTPKYMVKVIREAHVGKKRVPPNWSSNSLKTFKNPQVRIKPRISK